MNSRRLFNLILLSYWLESLLTKDTVMSQKQVSTTSAADIQRVIDDSCKAHTGNEILQMATSNNDTCKEKPSRKTSTTKSRSSSSSSPSKPPKKQKKESFDERIDSLEEKNGRTVSFNSTDCAIFG